MSVPGRLQIDPATGHVTGPAHITYNDPWPCPSSDGPGITGAMQGVLMHTMVSDLPSCVATFNNPANKASAHFGISETGEIHQFFPIGKGYEAWHAVAANLTWYGVEHADAGHPDTPLTAAQINASAQILEVLSRFCGFPLAVTDRPAGRGFGTHSMGGEAWGGHTCPDVPPEHVRSAQRQAIVNMAVSIRTPPPTWQSAAAGLAKDATATSATLTHQVTELAALIAANQ
jgi:N-acetylmuramoyl-L-alanine amidase-like protein